MKIHRYVIVVVLLCLSYAKIQAQDTAGGTSITRASQTKFPLFKGRLPYRTWSVSAHAGALSPLVYTGGTNDFSKWDANLGYGLSVRKQLAHSFGLEASFTSGHLSGNNKDQLGGVAYGFKSFETRIRVSSLMGVVNVATVDFLRKENWINFLVKAGYSVTTYSNSVVDANDQIIYNSSLGTKHQFTDKRSIPAGVGVKFKISDHLNFDLGYNMYFVNSDDVDGAVVKSTSKDKYSYAYSGLEFSIGKYKKPTLDWANPVAILYDDLVLRNDSAALIALRKRVSTLEKEVDDLKCDSDNDGIGDLFDKCPSTPPGVTVSGSGCPLDTDQDSIYDYVDKCPLVKGTKANNGCPEVEKVQTITRPTIQLTPEEQKILQDVFENLEFATGKWIIKAVSFPSLNKLATLLITKPNYSLKISGHTDAIGSEKANQTLSVNRANAVKAYLVKRGVSKNKIEARGYGESQPIADNDTEEGRQRNRRVEFNIF